MGHLYQSTYDVNCHLMFVNCLFAPSLHSIILCSPTSLSLRSPPYREMRSTDKPEPIKKGRTMPDLKIDLQSVSSDKKPTSNSLPSSPGNPLSDRKQLPTATSTSSIPIPSSPGNPLYDRKQLSTAASTSLPVPGSPGGMAGDLKGRQSLFFDNVATKVVRAVIIDTNTVNGPQGPYTVSFCFFLFILKFKKRRGEENLEKLTTSLGLHYGNLRRERPSYSERFQTLQKFLRTCGQGKSLLRFLPFHMQLYPLSFYQLIVCS